MKWWRCQFWFIGQFIGKEEQFPYGQYSKLDVCWQLQGLPEGLQLKELRRFGIAALKKLLVAELMIVTTSSGKKFDNSLLHTLSLSVKFEWFIMYNWINAKINMHFSDSKVNMNKLFAVSGDITGKHQFLRQLFEFFFNVWYYVRKYFSKVVKKFWYVNSGIFNFLN